MTDKERYELALHAEYLSDAVRLLEDEHSRMSGSEFAAGLCPDEKRVREAAALLRSCIKDLRSRAGGDYVG